MSRLRYLGVGLALAPKTLRRLVAQVDPLRVDDRLSDDRFSLREVLAHMADLEPVILYRMQLALSNPGAEIPNWDQDEEAIKKNYGSWDVGETLDLFTAERAKTVDFFESLSNDQTLSSLKHPVLGTISIFDLATFILGHDCYHFEQITEYFPA